MFEGFATLDLAVGETSIHARIGGSGPPVLLLHGYPQTHIIWHKIAPRLAERFTVVATDLRGYGDSGKPESDPQHLAYAKRTMARDQIAVMQHLGHRQFAVVGHDRGARVAQRMALDHPDAVERMVLLDIVPTRHVFATVTQAVASGYYHWFFLIQPNRLPETLIGHDPQYYLQEKLKRWCGADRSAITAAAFAEYLRCFNDPAAIHASCEDYRAAATIDLVHDEVDRGRRIGCPLLVLWGQTGLVGGNYDVVAVWRDYATDVRGRALPCGHYLAEEAPKETLAELLGFLG